MKPAMDLAGGTSQEVDPRHGGAVSNVRAAAARQLDTRGEAPVARAPLIAPVGIGAVLALAVGWSVRDDHYWVPSEGLGYLFGVAGLAMMILLLLYSARKRSPALRRVGPIQRWFQIHMALGILGPTAIVLHSNFNLGSMNANVALACMLTVSLSGIVGRFIYTRIHYEYLGRLASLDELLEASRDKSHTLAASISAVPEIGRILADFRRSALASQSNAGSQEGSPAGERRAPFVLLGRRSRAARRRALRVYRSAETEIDVGLPSPREVSRAVRDHLRTVRAAAEFRVYERLFALWHALHLPFCIVMFLAATVHLVAVHMY